MRFVGFTGHRDRAIHLEMLSHGYPSDSIPMPDVGRKQHGFRPRASWAADTKRSFAA